MTNNPSKTSVPEFLWPNGIEPTKSVGSYDGHSGWNC